MFGSTALEAAAGSVFVYLLAEHRLHGGQRMDYVHSESEGKGTCSKG
jgi:hypothetical protein